MNGQASSTRWWENYLVRYFMPSIAGTAIVSWLASIAGPQFRALLLLPSSAQQLDGATLALLFLYGNLFCYIASYPVLCFHVTRVLDFASKVVSWPASFRDGYIVTIVVGGLTLVASVKLDGQDRVTAAFGIVSVFVISQISRLWSVVVNGRISVTGLKDDVSPAFGFAYALARRRGVAEESVEDTKSGDITNDVIERSRTIRWRSELMDTYRHLREHGNSAFIFVLEIILAALCYSVIDGMSWSPEKQLSALGILFAIWALPSMFVHLLGQHLERRFSWYDQRLKSKKAKRRSR